MDFKKFYLIALIIFVEPAGATIIANSTFDTSLDGWTGLLGETTLLTHELTGGNPGGYIQNIDQGQTAGNILAPAVFLGDWSILDGVGTLSWDFNLIDPGVGNIVPLTASIFGPGGSATFNSGIIAPIGNWITITAIIDESAWSVNTGTWISLLADVTELRLQIENVFSTAFTPEITGIDNVTLSQVPEPPIFWGFISLCAFLIYIRPYRAV